MAAIELNFHPTNRQLRQFGAMALVALPLAGWLFSGKPTPFSWQPFHTTLVGSLAAAGVLMAVVGYFRPGMLRGLFIAAMIVAFPIGLVLSEVILLLIYAVVFVPVALVFRLIGRDALERGIDRQRDSYWQPKSQPKDARSYYRQS